MTVSRSKPRKKQPDNIEWIVTGRVVLDAAWVVVHAKTRTEALEKANNGDFFGEIDYGGASIIDLDFKRAEANVDGE